MTPAKTGAEGHGLGGGLVPYKTSLGDTVTVSFGASVVAERRVNRLKRSVWASGHLHKLTQGAAGAPVPWFVTLTYAQPDAWKADHISRAVQHFRNWCRRLSIPCRYTWVAEIQPKRLERTGKAVVHYHLIAWLPWGHRMPKWDQGIGKRAAFWPHGMANRDEAKTGVGYLMKYLSKLGEFHRFPRGLRLYGVGGLDAAARSVRQWFNLPCWAKDTYGVGELARVAGRLVVCATGEVLSSPWRLQLVPGGAVLRLIGELPERLGWGAYSRVNFT